VILRLKDSAYTERLASFLRSLGQDVDVVAQDAVELQMRTQDERAARIELGIYLRVWNVLYPDAEVTIEQ
jgi:hypothetical protein